MKIDEALHSLDRRSTTAQRLAILRQVAAGSKDSWAGSAAMASHTDPVSNPCRHQGSMVQ